MKLKSWGRVGAMRWPREETVITREDEVEVAVEDSEIEVAVVSKKTTCLNSRART